MTDLVHIDSAIEGLFASTPEPLPFPPSLHIRAFLLRRDAGNMLVPWAATPGPPPRASAPSVGRDGTPHVICWGLDDE